MFKIASKSEAVIDLLFSNQMVEWGKLQDNKYLKLQR